MANDLDNAQQLKRPVKLIVLVYEPNVLRRTFVFVRVASQKCATSRHRPMALTNTAEVVARCCELMIIIIHINRTAVNSHQQFMFLFTFCSDVLMIRK